MFWRVQNRARPQVFTVSYALIHVQQERLTPPLCNLQSKSRTEMRRSLIDLSSLKLFTSIRYSKMLHYYSRRLPSSEIQAETRSSDNG